jgi:hypothetical protein
MLVNFSFKVNKKEVKLLRSMTGMSGTWKETFSVSGSMTTVLFETNKNTPPEGSWKTMGYSE